MMEKLQDILIGKKKKKILSLDIGTEAIKLMTFDKDKRLVVSELNLEYFDQYGVFDGQNFGSEVIKKGISRVLANLKDKNDFSEIIISLPPNVLKAKVVLEVLERKKGEEIINEKEEKTIFKLILERAKEKFQKEWQIYTGLLERDIHFLNFKILEIKIDGYRVPCLKGYRGKSLEFKIFFTFLTDEYFRIFEKVFQEIKFKKIKIFHLGEGLIAYLKNFDYFPDSLFFDFGGEISQYFLVKNKTLEAVGELFLGTKFFSQILSEKLRIKLDDARILKEKYARGEFSSETAARFRQFFDEGIDFWIESFRKELDKNLLPSSFFQDIYIFGGGAFLPAIKESLEKIVNEESFVNRVSTVRFFLPEELKEVKTENILQYVPCFLIALCSNNKKIF